MAVLCVCLWTLVGEVVLEPPPAVGGSSPQGPQWKELTRQLLGAGGRGQALETKLKSDSCRVWTRGPVPPGLWWRPGACAPAPP